MAMKSPTMTEAKILFDSTFQRNIDDIEEDDTTVDMRFVDTIAKGSSATQGLPYGENQQYCSRPRGNEQFNQKLNTYLHN